MSVVVVTRMQAADLLAVRAGMSLTGTVLEGLTTSPGFLGGRVRIDRRKAMWTVTVWFDPAFLDLFRVLHAEVAARGPEVSDDMQLTAWQQETDRVPTWTQVRTRWTQVMPPALGLSRAIHPSAAVRERVAG